MHSTTHFHAQQTHQFIVVATFNRRQRCPPTRGFFPSSSSSSPSRGRENDHKRTTRKNSNRSRFGKRSSSFASSSSSSRNDDELGAFLCRSSTSDDDVNIKNNNDDAIFVSLPLNELKPGEKQSRVSSTHRRSEFVQISSNKAKTINPPENLSKLQLFGRKYWPLLATLELLALIGASLNGVLSRKRRQEIERLNVQMRAIMQRVEDERFERHNKKTSSTTSSSPAMVLIGKAKSAYANGEYESAIGLFNDAVEAADGGAFSSADEEDKIEESLSARKGLATAYQASGDLTKAAATLENALLVARDSTVFGMLGDVYTDMGELAKAGEMYDKCLEAMD
tara:strand:- start:119 stop:1132 length:1014 start_codon:yes stop_codon:yes gene_type:complete